MNNVSLVIEGSGDHAQGHGRYFWIPYLITGLRVNSCFFGFFFLTVVFYTRTIELDHAIYLGAKHLGKSAGNLKSL